MNYFFTSDEHYYHYNAIKYCNRPFKTIEEMNEELIKRHNEIVKSDDMVIHAGDFTLKNRIEAEKIQLRLNGQHYYIRGSHDKWMDRTFHEMWTKTINKHHIVVCHYAMLVWPRSHYNSFLLFGHSHGALNNIVQGKCYDVGVDSNNFYPVSFDQIIEVMKDKPDNFNLVKKYD